MYKATITYEDYDGNTQTDDLYFNLSKPEIAKLQFSVEGGLDKYIEKITDNEHDGKDAELGKVYDLFSDLLKQAYGRRSEDGKRFVKTEKATEEFLQSKAYDEYMFKLMTNEAEMDAFVDGTLPDLSQIENKIQNMKNSQ